jgi:hypothetical protein
MKKRAKLTPFAKIVILAVVVLLARYAYIHRAEIASGEFFNFSDTTETEIDSNQFVHDTLAGIDSLQVSDSLGTDSVSHMLITDAEGKIDTVTLIIRKEKDVLSIITEGKSINILLSDSVLVSDTIYFNIPKAKESIGRIIIK